MTSEEIFQKARQAFQLRDDDNPDCILYYRDWAGICAVVGQEKADKFNSFIHNAMFYANPAHTWEGIKCGLTSMIKEMTVPEKPTTHICWAVEPNQDVEGRAYEMFKVQFKQEFPQKRINSKFAKEKWQEKKTLAMKYAQENVDCEMDRYREEVNCVEAKNQRVLEEWQNKIHSMALLEKFVRELP